MKNQLYATLKEYHRINGSNLGNPNYEVTLDIGDGSATVLRSSSNSSWCYGINGQWLDKTVCYHLTRSGRIDYMKVMTIEDTFADPLLTLREGQ